MFTCLRSNPRQIDSYERIAVADEKTKKQKTDKEAKTAILLTYDDDHAQKFSDKEPDNEKRRPPTPDWGPCTGDPRWMSIVVLAVFLFSYCYRVPSLTGKSPELFEEENAQCVILANRDPNHPYDTLNWSQKVASWFECNEEVLGVLCGVIFLFDIFVQLVLRPYCCCHPELLEGTTYCNWFWKTDNLYELFVNFHTGVRDLFGWSPNPSMQFLLKPVTWLIRHCIGCSNPDSLSNDHDCIDYDPPKVKRIEIVLEDQPPDEGRNEKSEKSWSEVCCGHICFVPSPLGCWSLIMFIATVVSILKDFGVAELTKMAYEQDEISRRLLQAGSQWPPASEAFAPATTTMPFTPQNTFSAAAQAGALLATPYAPQAASSAAAQPGVLSAAKSNPAEPVLGCDLFGLDFFSLAHYDYTVQCHPAAPPLNEGWTTTIMFLCALLFLLHAVMQILEGCFGKIRFSATQLFELAAAITVLSSLGLGALQAVLGRFAKPALWMAKGVMRWKKAMKAGKDAKGNLEDLEERGKGITQ